MSEWLVIIYVCRFKFDRSCFVEVFFSFSFMFPSRGCFDLDHAFLTARFLGNKTRSFSTPDLSDAAAAGEVVPYKFDILIVAIIAKTRKTK